MPQYQRRQRDTVEAFYYTGPKPEFGEWMKAQGENGAGAIQPGGNWGEDYVLVLQTIQGEWVNCAPGEWIVREPLAPEARFYPCDRRTFEQLYDVPEVSNVVPLPTERGARRAVTQPAGGRQ